MLDHTWQNIGKQITDVYSHFIGKKRILVVSQLFPPFTIGGAESAAYEQSRMLKKLNFKVKIFCGKLDNSQTQYEIHDEESEFDISRINLHNKDFDHTNYANLSKPHLEELFKKQLLIFNPDIVHFHNIYAFSLKLVDICQKFEIPTIMTLHDYWPICTKNILVNDLNDICQKNNMTCLNCKNSLLDSNGDNISLPDRNLIIRQTLEKCNLLISPSQYLANAYIRSGYPRKLIRVIKYGIDLRRFNKKNNESRPNRIRFAYVGQLVGHKGVDILLLAFSMLNESARGRVRVDIVGTGPDKYLNHLKEIADSHKLDKIVRFKGSIDNKQIHTIYDKNDVLIVPSVWPENSPVCIYEAMASGMPVIASNIGGIPELVEDNATGLLFDSRNPDDLCKQIKSFINYPSLINQMGQMGFDKIKKFNLDCIVDSIKEEYHKILVNRA